jgi:trehalose/maltose hydrolase-like predicted phosphorylase
MAAAECPMLRETSRASVPRVGGNEAWVCRRQKYARVLDMPNGVLQRDLVWSTAAGKHVAVNSCRLVSLEHRHLVAVAYEVSVDRM